MVVFFWKFMGLRRIIDNHAHNLKAAGLNRAPATNNCKGLVGFR